MPQEKVNLNVNKTFVKEERIGIVALGSNLNLNDFSPEMVIIEALAQFSKFGLQISAISRFYQTPAFPVGTGPDFVNAAVVIRSAVPVDKILAALHEIEATLGRQRKKRWAQRTIDLDLIFFGEKVYPNKKVYCFWKDLHIDQQMVKIPNELIIPHPRMHERGFVLIPVSDIAADMIHPVFGKSVLDLLKKLPQDDLDAIELL